MKYLLTGYYFNGYHGSMMHLCEIGEYLVSQNNEVEIVSVVVEEEIRNYVQGMGMRLLDVDEVEESTVYDYALCYHYPVLPLILEKGVQIGKIVFGSLSGMVPLELPSLLMGSDYFLHVHNERLKSIFSEKYGINQEQVFVIPNLVKDDFFSVKKECNPKPERIAVVSNHVPTEVRTLREILEPMDIAIDYYGVEDTYVPVTKEILCNYDVIISIGKTVQYALALGIPVFLYDHFGGNGYITLNNMDEEEHYNFSGRNDFRKLTADALAAELINNYSKVLDEVSGLRKIAEKRYLASRNISHMFAEYARPFVYKTEMTLYTKQIATLTSLAKSEVDTGKRILALQQKCDVEIDTMEKLVASAGQYFEYPVESQVNLTQDSMYLDRCEIKDNLLVLSGWAVCDQSRLTNYNISLLVCNTQKNCYYYIPTHCIYRGDVQEVFPNYNNAGHCGFQSSINIGYLSLGTYKVFLCITNQQTSFLLDIGRSFCVEKSGCLVE